jgi:hypothetical protein
MRRVGFVLGVSVVMAAMVVLIAGSVLAKDPQQKQTYVDEVVATQYFALPGSAASFRGGPTTSKAMEIRALTERWIRRLPTQEGPVPGSRLTSLAACGCFARTDLSPHL